MTKTKKRKIKVGAVIYTIFMVLWAAALCYGAYFIWTSAMRVGEYWEKAQINPKVDAYMERLDTELWQNGENGLENTIAQMEHPYQSNAECVEVLKDILKEDISCLPGSGTYSDSVKVFDLFSGRSKFGQVTVVQKPFVPQENKLVNWAIEYWSLYPWEVQGVQFYLDGLYTTFDITVPEYMRVQLNGHLLGEENIVERGIPYDVLEEYYDEFDGLPTKVKYHADTIFGRVDLQLLDRNGQPTTIDPEQDDSQFIEPVSEELVARFDNFASRFVERYLNFSSGVGDVWYQYGLLKGWVLAGSDLEDRLERTLRSYLEFMHNSNFNFNGYVLNGVTALGNDMYVLDVSADAGSQMPVGYVKVHRDMKIYIKYYPQRDEAFAFSVEDYNTEESDFIGG